jgi:hypothetical protein
MPGKYTSHLKNTDRELSFYKEKVRLRSVYKKWKVGLISWEDVAPEDQLLLEKYYGVRDQ